MNAQVLIPLLLGIGLCGWGLYQFLRIRGAEKVTADVIGYDESYEANTDPTDDGMRRTMVYRYTWNGRSYTYRSSVVMGMAESLLQRRDSKTLYVSKDGKVYELYAAVVWLVMGLSAVIFGVVELL